MQEVRFQVVHATGSFLEFFASAVHTVLIIKGQTIEQGLVLVLKKICVFWQP